MTTPEIIHNLKTNPYFAVEIVVDNNPSQVASNMAIVYGQVPEYSIDQLKDLIIEILDNGTKTDKANVLKALKVRWIPEHASPSLNAAYNSITNEAENVRIKVEQNRINAVKKPLPTMPTKKAGFMDGLFKKKTNTVQVIQGLNKRQCIDRGGSYNHATGYCAGIGGLEAQ